MRYCFIAFALLSTVSCASKLDVEAEYVLSQEELKELLANNDQTLVLFYTEWCGAAQHLIKTSYLPLNDSIRAQGLDLQIIMLAGDEKVPLDTLNKHRDLGIKSYYIERPGANPLFNRMAIKSYINELFPDNKLERIQKTQYGIPVELWISADLEFLNEDDYSKAHRMRRSIVQPDGEKG